MDIFNQLFTILQDRQTNPQPGSYTNTLFDAGQDEIIKKVGEEAVEVILAAKGQGNQRLTEETADLLYHLFVLLVNEGVTLDDIRAELIQRHQPKGSFTNKN